MKSRCRKIITTIDWPLFLLRTVGASQNILWVQAMGRLGVFVLRRKIFVKISCIIESVTEKQVTFYEVLSGQF